MLFLYTKETQALNWSRLDLVWECLFAPPRNSPGYHECLNKEGGGDWGV